MAFIAGTVGSDTLTGDTGGGAENDTIFGYYGSDLLSGLLGEDSIRGGYGNDTLNGGDGNDVLIGDYDVNSYSNDGADSLVGGNGLDTLFGGGGADVLSGGADADLLRGGRGDDALTGGSGADVFLIDAILATATVDQLDVIMDFSSVAADRIDVSGLGIAEFATVQQLLETVSSKAQLVYRSNGFVQTTRLDNIADHTTLIAADFIFSTDTTSGSFYGSSYNDDLFGGLGNDTISGNNGDDGLFGEAGNDTVRGQRGLDTLFGADGNDSLSGDYGNYSNYFDAADLLAGGAGNDTLDGGGGDDDLDGGTDADLLRGSDGIDTLIGGSGNDTLLGGAGDDVVNGGTGADNFTVDTLVAAVQDDEFTDFSKADGDRIDLSQIGIAEFATVQQLLSSAGGNSFLGYNRAGNAQTSQITGLADSSTLVAGDFVFSTDATDNYSSGTSYNDDLFGGLGNDTITGANGDDRLFGEAGNDTVLGAFGQDTVFGADGNDSLSGDYGNSSYYADGADEVSGGAGNDTLNGGGANDSLNGGSQADLLRGNDGIDTLIGGTGNDTLIGGAGDDLVTGGTGADNFSVDSAAAGVHDDEFTDFSKAAGDRIDLSQIGIAEFATVQQLLSSGGGNSFLTYQFNGAHTSQITGLADSSTLVAGDFVFSAAVTDDFLSGTAYADDLFGGLGNDTMYGGAGADRLFSEAGNDTLYAGGGDDLLSGAAGNDSMRGASGLDTLSGGDGNDLLNGDFGPTAYYGDGNDVVTGGAGLDTLTGGGGNDSLDGGSDADTLSGNYGNDTVTGGTGADLVVVDVLTAAAAQSDVVTDFSIGELDRLDISALGISEFATVQQLLSSAAGDSFLTYQRGGIALTTELTGLADSATLDAADFVFSAVATNDYVGGTGFADDLFGGLGNDTVNGSSGDDRLFGEAGNDLVFGRYGNDQLFGSAGSDLLHGDYGNSSYGNDGNDVISGGAGIDTLNGGGGNDALDGGADDDVLRGNDGNDTLLGGAGADSMVGGAGTNTLSYAGSAAGVTVALATNTATGGDATGDTISGFDNLTGSSNADNLTGGTGANVVDGGDGDDTIVGTAGADTLNGGNDTDTLSYAPSGAAVTVSLATNTASGGDAAGDVISNFENLLGSAGNDSLTGNGSANVLDGGGGIDTLVGGGGDDSFVVDTATDTLTEAGAGGTDTVRSSITFTLAGLANIENLTLTGGAAINGTGSAGNNLITGNGAANVLDGGGGIDTLVGGGGDDTFEVDTTTDTITEAAAGGADTVRSSVTFSLAAIAEVENLLLLGAAAINGTGNALANTLTGNTGDNVLEGGAGIDTLIGGSGNDSFVVDSTTDTITEAGGEGTDTVQSSVTISIAAVANVEDLTLTGAGAINGTGNSLANTITGNSGNNSLNGGGAADTLNGGNGIDTLVGGGGDDLFVVNTTTDTLTEAGGGGTDRVNASVTFSLAAIAQVENLTLTGAAAINGTGNALGNVLTGNSAANVLDGGGGIDTLVGGGDNDTYVVDSTTDTLTEAAAGGTDRVDASVTFSLAALGEIENLMLTGAAAINGTGNAGANTLTGNTGDNVLDGGGGIDTLAGGTGNDTYVVDSTTDTLTEAAAGGTDRVDASVTFSLAAFGEIENLMLTGGAAIDGTGNGLGNVLTGNTGDNVLNGGAGLDTLIGGSGNDVFVVNSTTDTITEAAAGGTDRVSSSVTFSLAAIAEVENLTLTGAAAINGTGNALGNVLTSNSAANVLDGGGGIDTLVGGGDNDTYVVDTTTDTITESGASGTDTVQSSVSFSLAAIANVENLTLTGGAAINGTGSAGANVLTGNTGDNVLDGGGGIDTLAGGTGNDTYVVDSTTDTLTEAAAGGTDRVDASVTFSLAAFGEIENLTLTGAAAINGTGNALGNLLSGNTGDNVLNGGAGVDTLIGGSGNDVFVVNSTTDTITEAAAGGTDRVESTVSFSLAALAEVENLTLTGTAVTSGTGNALGNVLTGNTRNNILNGDAGVDTLVGGAGNDTYVVDSTTDTITEAAASGTDRVNSGVSFSLAAIAEVESLRLTGGGAKDGTGNELANTLFASNGSNVLDGGLGRDTASYQFAISAVTLSLLVAGAQATGGSGSDTLVDIENLSGSAHNDLLTGNGSANTLRGLDGNDSLAGGSGVDVLLGGAGADTVSGGTHADKFSFDALADLGSGATADVITDFSTAQGDRIDLAKIDWDPVTAGDQAFGFVANFSTAGGEVRFSGGMLFLNTDTDVDAEFEIVLSGVATLAASDLIL